MKQHRNTPTGIEDKNATMFLECILRIADALEQRLQTIAREIIT